MKKINCKHSLKYAKGLCARCYDRARWPKRKEKAREWRKQNRDRCNAWVRQQRKKYPERYREYNRKKREKLFEKTGKRDPVRDRRAYTRRNKDRDYFRNVQRYFGISEEQYRSLMQQQNNLCPICRRSIINDRLDGKRVHVDHDHAVKQKIFVRGLLCSKCNRLLGLANDSIELLTNAISYLHKTNIARDQDRGKK